MKWSLYSAHRGAISLDKPAVMAIMNATPDSFSDGGQLDEDDQLDERIASILRNGADIIDVGGESTRPGHQPVAGNEETARVVRVIQAIRSQDKSVPISIDTQKVSVARNALQAGADFVNDVSALSDPAMARVVEEVGCSVVMMRNRALNQPVAQSCKEQMRQLLQNAGDLGVARERIILDPGLGFGDLLTGDFSKPPGGDPVANLELIFGINLYSHGLPILIGGSRKRFIGALTDEAIAKRRLAGSVAIAIESLNEGATILRVHDVGPTVQARNIMVSV